MYWWIHANSRSGYQTSGRDLLRPGKNVITNKFFNSYFLLYFFCVIFYDWGVCNEMFASLSSFWRWYEKQYVVAEFEQMQNYDSYRFFFLPGRVISHRLRPVTGPITRSSNDSTLIVAHVGRNCIGDKSFYVTAPRLWNALPRNIREGKSLTVFKKMLKSHLYPKYWLALCLYFALFFHLSALI